MDSRRDLVIDDMYRASREGLLKGLRYSRDWSECEPHLAKQGERDGKAMLAAGALGEGGQAPLDEALSLAGETWRARGLGGVCRRAGVGLVDAWYAYRDAAVEAMLVRAPTVYRVTMSPPERAAAGEVLLVRGWSASDAIKRAMLERYEGHVGHDAIFADEGETCTLTPRTTYARPVVLIVRRVVESTQAA